MAVYINYRVVFTPLVIPAQAGIQEHPKTGYLPHMNTQKRRYDGVFVLYTGYGRRFGVLDPRDSGDDEGGKMCDQE